MFRGIGTRPDWVILGARNTPNGVTVMASRLLQYMQLDWEMRYHDASPELSMQLRMGNLVIVEAPTYGEALRRLFEQFDPETSSQPALPAAVTGIEAGPKAVSGGGWEATRREDGGH